MRTSTYPPRDRPALGAAWALLAAVLLSCTFPSADAFSVRAPIVGRQGATSFASLPAVPRRGTAIAAAGEESDDAGKDAETPLEAGDTFKMHPALTREEIERILSDVPVYGVVSEDSGDAVLLREPDTEESISYFFFNPDTANSAFAGLKEKGGGADWAITRFTLGDIWFELLDGDDADGQGDGGRFVMDGIEYRLVPDGIEIGGARSLLEQSAEAMGVEASTAFLAPYNEIPVFLDQSLRIESNGEERFPMYLGLQDLVQTCQMVMANDSEEASQYTAMVVVADLRDLVKQMQEESEVEFRRVVMFPPTPQKAQAPPEDESTGMESKKFKDVANLGTTDWSD